MLKKKEWNYSAAGILDRTHLRFFTIKSIQEMFKSAGFNIIRIERILSASNVKKKINQIFQNKFADVLTEQYIVVALKSE